MESWSFAFPYAFLLLPLPIVALWLLPRRRADTGALVVPLSIADGLTTSAATGVRARARSALPLLLWLSLLIAFAGPQKLEAVEALPASGRDLMLAFDLSGSMEQEDFTLDGETASRLAVVKRVAQSFVKARAGDRVGLVVFAETAYVAAPLTFDVASVARIVEEATIGISGRSTSIADGLGLALKRLEESDARSRVVVLLSDGADTSGTVEPIDAAALAARLGIKVHTIALGSRDLETDPKARDAVDSATLRAIAEASGGEAFRVRDTDDLQAVAEAIDQLETSAFDRPAATIERGYWPYPAGLALATCLVLLVARRAT